MRWHKINKLSVTNLIVLVRNVPKWNVSFRTQWTTMTKIRLFGRVSLHF